MTDNNAPPQRPAFPPTSKSGFKFNFSPSPVNANVSHQAASPADQPASKLNSLRLMQQVPNLVARDRVAPLVSRLPTVFGGRVERLTRATTPPKDDSDNSTADPSTDPSPPPPSTAFSFKATPKPFAFTAAVAPSTDCRVDLPPKLVEPPGWKRWLSTPIVPRSAFDDAVKEAPALSVVSYFAALNDVFPLMAPRPLAPMVLQMVSVVQHDVPVEIGALMDCLKLQSPNWWRNVKLRDGDIDVRKYMPRVRQVEVSYFADFTPDSFVSQLAAACPLRRLSVLSDRNSDFSLLGRFTQLRTLYVAHIPLQDEHLPVVAGLPNLTALTIVSCVALTDYRALARCRTLEMLELDQVVLKSFSLDGLETLPNLQSLLVSDLVHIDIHRLGFLGRAPTLQRLTLALLLDYDGLRGLEESSTLEELTLSEATGRLSDVSYLKQLATLKTLRVHSVAIPAANVAQSIPPALTHLVLKSGEWSDDAFDYLNEAQSLTTLELGFPSALLLRRFESCPNVRTLFLEWGDDTDDLVGIDRFKNVERLILKGFYIAESESFYVRLSQLPLLTSLAVDKTSFRTAPALSHVSTITKLELRSCGYLTDEGLRHVAQLPSLTELSLMTAFTLTDVRPVLSSPSKLRCLRLSWVDVSDAGFDVPSPSLSELTIEWCEKLSAYCCLHLVAAADTLRKLQLEHGPFERRDVDRLRTLMPRTKVLG